jgi:hypothetical protein
VGGLTRQQGKVVINHKLKNIGKWSFYNETMKCIQFFFLEDVIKEGSFGFIKFLLFCKVPTAISLFLPDFKGKVS